MGRMRKFGKLLQKKLWAAVVAVVGGCLPWTISLFAKDTFKQTIKNIAERTDVSSGFYQLMAISAAHPVSATLALLVLIVGGAALYSAVEADKRASPELAPPPRIESNTDERVRYEALLETKADREARRDMTQKQLDAALLEIAKLKSRGTTAPKEKATPPLKLEYVSPNGTERPKLVFKVRDGSPAVKIKRVGPLVSEERYIHETSLTMLQQEIPEVDKGERVECQFFPELGPVLELGGPMTIDFIKVDYTPVGGNEIIQCQYFLHKNADGSIVFSSEKPNIDSKSLHELKNRLRLLKDAATCFAVAEVHEGLVRDIAAIRERLEAGHHDGTFERPLSLTVQGDPEHLSELRDFQRLYLEHQVRADAAKVSYSSLLKNMGDETATYQEVLDAIHKYQMTLTNMAAHTRRTYAAIADTEIPKATLSLMGHT